MTPSSRNGDQRTAKARQGIDPDLECRGRAVGAVVGRVIAQTHSQGVRRRRPLPDPYRVTVVDEVADRSDQAECRRRCSRQARCRHNDRGVARAHRAVGHDSEISRHPQARDEREMRQRDGEHKRRRSPAARAFPVAVDTDLVVDRVVGCGAGSRSAGVDLRIRAEAHSRQNRGPRTRTARIGEVPIPVGPNQAVLGRGQDIDQGIDACTSQGQPGVGAERSPLRMRNLLPHSGRIREVLAAQGASAEGGAVALINHLLVKNHQVRLGPGAERVAGDETNHTRVDVQRRPRETPRGVVRDRQRLRERRRRNNETADSQGGHQEKPQTTHGNSQVRYLYWRTDQVNVNLCSRLAPASKQYMITLTYSLLTGALFVY